MNTNKVLKPGTYECNTIGRGDTSLLNLMITL